MSNRHQFISENRVLHVVYLSPEDIPPFIIEIADKYEGHVKSRIGFNFPLSRLVFSSYPQLKAFQDCQYAIVYKRGDVLTKKHELQHAKYYMDPQFKQEVLKLWTSFSEKFRSNALGMLRRMNYQDNMEILLDEFQAYYFTEKPNFFGKE